MNESTNQVESSRPKKASKKSKIYSVSSVAVIGKMAKKLGCFEKSERELFIDQLLRKTDNIEFIKFKSEYASSQKELDEFIEKINSCDISLQF